jgi:hypothetical protein
MDIRLKYTWNEIPHITDQEAGYLTATSPNAVSYHYYSSVCWYVEKRRLGRCNSMPISLRRGCSSQYPEMDR